MSKSILAKSVNTRTLLMSVSTVIFGTAAATVVGNEELLPAVLCLFFGIFFQMAFNLRHRYHDFIYGYGENAMDELEQNNDTSIPTRMVLREGSLAATIISITFGLGILSFAGWWTIILGALLCLLAWINYLGSHQLTRTPFGLLVTFLLFGPIGVGGTMLVQLTAGFNNGSMAAHNLSLHEVLPAIYFGCVSGFMAVNCHLAFCAETVQNDTLNGKKTFTVKYGPIGAEMLYLFDGLMMIVSLLIMQIYGHLSFRWYVMIMPVIIGLCYFAMWRKVHGKIGHKGYALLENYSLLSMLVMAIWLLAFYLVFGEPDMSQITYFF